MLLTKDLIEGIEDKYIPMLKMINIPDFTKCIAQFSGLPISKVSEAVIKRYLHTWAKNKYKFFKMLGNNLRLDQDFEYTNTRSEVTNELKDIIRDFPAFGPWLEGFSNQTSNIIDVGLLKYPVNEYIRDYFSRLSVHEMNLTHFFKVYLKAPDRLVTRIAAIYENAEISAKHTISIDPIDMMLASETPYNWDSCYKLDITNNGSHADGCLAAVLDDSSLITYIWNKEGKYSLYNRYDLKNVRYKRIRQWISISPKMTSVYFNDIYPAKDRYEISFEHSMRNKVETFISNYLQIENLWHEQNSCVYRKFMYGYTEFDKTAYSYIEADDETWTVYNEEIECPCGCGEYLPGNCALTEYETDEYDNSEFEYSGEGFIHSSFTLRHWCDFADKYCYRDNCEANEFLCEGCPDWERIHPICNFYAKQGIKERCPYELPYYTDMLNKKENIVYPNKSFCKDDCNCKHWNINSLEEKVFHLTTTNVEKDGLRYVLKAVSD